MNKKDIALTVGGILATIVVAYIIYYRQQTDAANAAAQNQAAVDAEAQAEAQAQYSNQYQYASGSYVSVPSLSIPSEVDTSANTGTNGTDAGTDQNDLLSNIINTFASSINQTSTKTDPSSLIIPTVISTSGNTLSGIPVTATDALSETGLSNGATVSPGSTIPVSSTTSTDHNSAMPVSSTVHFDHIVDTGQ